MTATDASAQDYYQKALDYERNNEPEKAIWCCSFAISSKAGFIDAYKLRADLFFAQQHYQEAIKDYAFLMSVDDSVKYIEKRAVCNEKTGNLQKSLELYLDLLLQNVDNSAYKNIYRIVKEHPEFKTRINFLELDSIISRYVDEKKALMFKNSASEFNLDQRNDFLDLYLNLLPKNSEYLYDAYVQKALAEVFRYRICKDKDFREEIKKTQNLTENELNQKYLYNAQEISELNLVYAVQKLNEATRYAKNLNEVNYLDDEVKKILKIANK